MGKDFYEREKTAAAVYDQASEWLGMDMRGLCFEENDRLDRTEYTQAALAATCLAMALTAREYGLKPDVTAGLSLGEYCALHTAGVMDLKDVLLTVRRRGILMEQAVPAGQGGMAAVLGLSAAQAEAAADKLEDVWIANYNCPGQIVITGKAEAVRAAAEPFSLAGARRVVPLNVSGPFHSPMLREAGRKLADVLEPVELKAPKIPYVTNVTADYVKNTEEIKPLLAEQISSPVRWQQSMERLLADGVDTFVEFGPGRTLGGFMKKISKDLKMYSVQTLEDLERTLQELNRSGQRRETV